MHHVGERARVAGRYFGLDCRVFDYDDDGDPDFLGGAPYGYPETDTERLGLLRIWYGVSKGGSYEVGDADATVYGPDADSTFPYALLDLDLDGVNDLVASAPYTDDRRGAVWVLPGGGL